MKSRSKSNTKASGPAMISRATLRQHEHTWALLQEMSVDDRGIMLKQMTEWQKQHGKRGAMTRLTKLLSSRKTKTSACAPDGTLTGTQETSPKKVHKVTGKQTVSKKAIGFGTAFFWMQMLMGDTADHIQGCPKIMNKKGDKLVLCGKVSAYDLLVDATSDKECLRIVMDAYKLTEDYTHYLTGAPCEWQEVFWSNAQMLWMQRTPGDINDVKKWTKEFLNA